MPCVIIMFIALIYSLTHVIVNTNDNYHFINMPYHSPFRKILSLWPWSCVVRPEGHTKILFPYSSLPPCPPVRNEFHILNPAAQLEGGGNIQFYQMANLFHIGGSKSDWRDRSAFPLVGSKVGISLHLLIASEFSEAGREECQGPHSVVFFSGQSSFGLLMFSGYFFPPPLTLLPVDLFNLNT